MVVIGSSHLVKEQGQDSGSEFLWDQVLRAMRSTASCISRLWMASKHLEESVLACVGKCKHPSYFNHVLCCSAWAEQAKCSKDPGPFWSLVALPARLAGVLSWLPDQEAGQAVNFKAAKENLALNRMGLMVGQGHIHKSLHTWFEPSKRQCTKLRWRRIDSGQVKGLFQDK